jgi:aromatic ring-opening dioxygenase LigB subunit
MIVAGAIVPHGELDDAPATRAAMDEVGRRLAAVQPEALAVVTPHNVHVEGHFALITASRMDERDIDHLLAAAAVESLREAGLPVVGVSFGGNDPAGAVAPMDWGIAVPLPFLPPVPLVAVSPARDRPLAEHVRAGEALARASADARVALVASADHGHAHDPDGPYGFDPAAAEYDAFVCEAVREGDLSRLLVLEDLAERAKADSLWQMLVLHGAFPQPLELLSYEAPTYYGMLCAA